MLDTARDLHCTPTTGTPSPLPQIWLAVLFSSLTAITTLNSAGVPIIQFLVDPFLTALSPQVGGCWGASGECFGTDALVMARHLGQLPT